MRPGLETSRCVFAVSRHLLSPLYAQGYARLYFLKRWLKTHNKIYNLDHFEVYSSIVASTMCTEFHKSSLELFHLAKLNSVPTE